MSKAKDHKEKPENFEEASNLSKVFLEVFKYDPATSGHVGDKPVTVSQLRQVFSALSGEESAEEATEEKTEVEA